MAGNVRVVGNAVYLPGYIARMPEVRKPKNFKVKCEKCGLTSSLNLIFIANVGKMGGSGRMSVECGNSSCKATVLVKYSL